MTSDNVLPGPWDTERREVVPVLLPLRSARWVTGWMIGVTLLVILGFAIDVTLGVFAVVLVLLGVWAVTSARSTGDWT